MKILIADDDEVFASVLAGALKDKGHDTATVTELGAILPALEGADYDHLLLDLMMGDESAMPLIPAIVALPSAPGVTVLTGYASVASTVQALRMGAAGYLAKPVGVREVLAAISNETMNDAADLKPMPLLRVEWEHIQRVLAEHDGNISATARALGIHRRTLQRKLEKKPPR